MVLTKDAAADVHAQMSDLDPDYPGYAEKGLVRFVDTYSHTIGAIDDARAPPYARFLDTPMDLNALSRAVNDTQHEVIRDHPDHRLVLDSVSTLVAYTNVNTTFRFLQVFVGKAKRAGATLLVHMDAGMHSDADVQMVKHLMDGVIHLKVQDAKRLIHVEGDGVTDDKGWVEYAYTDAAFNVTGSFAAGRIR
jgi:KaiC/GvpD/RAD55 family RecA-like ATPase